MVYQESLRCKKHRLNKTVEFKSSMGNKAWHVRSKSAYIIKMIAMIVMGSPPHGGFLPDKSKDRCVVPDIKI